MLGGTQWPVVLNPSAEPQEEGRSSAKSTGRYGTKWSE